MKIYTLAALLCILFVNAVKSAEIVIVPTGTTDDADHIQTALDGIEDGDTLRLTGDFVIARTIYLPSNFTWILDGTLTLSAAAELDEVGWKTDKIDASRRTGITEKTGGATNIDMSGGTYYGNSANYPNSMRFLNFISVSHSKFHDMVITEVTDDNFTLAPGSNHNECRNLVGSFSKSGNAMTDKGEYNRWIDCIASDCGSDGWTPKCRHSTFIRCVAANNAGPGFGMYAREEGYFNNKDVGARIIGNKFFDCISYGSTNSSGFSFNISGNCPGAIIRDNFIQAVCYDNQGSGVFFRNKDDAELGIVKDNVVDIVCYGNKGLRKNGDNSSWAGGLGMENDNSSSHNIIENITGSVICYDNRIDVNTRGGHNCNIKVYHPETENNPILDDKSSYNNSISVNDFNCSNQLNAWCQYEYCGAQTPPFPNPPADLTAEVVSSSQVDLRWTGTSENEEGYIIERKKGEYFIVIGSVEANTLAYSDIGLEENTEYTYRVQSYNISGYSDYTNEIVVTTDAVTGAIPKSGSELFLGSYPNPFKSTTRIEYALASRSQVCLSVFDLTGKQVELLVNKMKQAGRYTCEFSGQDLPCGLYYCRISADNKHQNIKMMLLK